MCIRTYTYILILGMNLIVERNIGCTNFHHILWETASGVPHSYRSLSVISRSLLPVGFTSLLIVAYWSLIRGRSSSLQWVTNGKVGVICSTCSLSEYWGYPLNCPSFCLRPKFNVIFCTQVPSNEHYYGYFTNKHYKGYFTKSFLQVWLDV